MPPIVITQMRASAYLDLHDLSWDRPGPNGDGGARSIWLCAGRQRHDLPPDQRFYAGGSGTVRGYPLSVRRPAVPRHRSAEARSEIWTRTSRKTPRWAASPSMRAAWSCANGSGCNWGFAVFTDAGRVGQTRARRSAAGTRSEWVRVARYYTPSARCGWTSAFPVHRSPNDDRLRSVYRPGTILLMPRACASP